MKKSDKFMIVGLAILGLGFLGYRKMFGSKKSEVKDNNEKNDTSVELGKTENVDDVRIKPNPKKVFKKVILDIVHNKDGYFYNLTNLDQFREEAKYQLLMSDFGLSAKVIESFPKTREEMEKLLTKTRTTRRVHQFLTDNRLRIVYSDNHIALQKKKRKVFYVRKKNKDILDTIV